ncbi:hypothetical protein [Hyalangium sp.]|uniref:hypothetical protein n=1 Tax=Hyalangium sp. TaxID=2028555 RepID=UPI002D2846E1|nr:hypothetical protein [Hyalangium sp.]HYI00403.1 hypothetical protein [Hyalangium sp.]
MRLSLGKSLWAAIFTLVLPLAQAQAQECVEFQGVNHCGIGAARLSVTDEGLKAESRDTTGKDGVAIHTGLSSNWTAALFSDNAGKDAQRTILTSVSEGAPTSTATLDTRGETTTYAATFTGSGQESTYSALLYRDGVLQAAVGGIRSGTPGIVSRPNPGWTPACRPYNQNYNSCISSCYSAGYPNCNYCNTPCRNTFHVTPRGACQWRFDLSATSLQLADGRRVEADELVLNEEVRGAASYPYLGFDQILIQSTAASMTIASESVDPVCK